MQDLNSVSIENAWDGLCKKIPPLDKGRQLWDYGAKITSQNGEDGILYRIFAEIGTTNKKIVEIGAGDGIECMAANLIFHHGFSATLIDGSKYWLEHGVRKYIEKNDPTLKDRVKFCHAWVTRENVVELLKEFGATGEIDLFSLDIDGNDYYVLKAIIDAGVLAPRVLVLEYQDILGPESTHTIVYDPIFNHQKFDCWGGPNYCGAALSAFRYLLDKQYAFVGCEEFGFNAFFVRRDLVTKFLPEMTDIGPCFQHPKVVAGMHERAPRTAHLPWVDVRTLE